MTYAQKRSATLGILVWSCVSFAAVISGCQGQNVKNDAVGTVPFVDWATLKTSDPRTSDVINFPSHIGVEMINGHALVDSAYDGRASCTSGQCKLHPGSHTVVVSYAWSQTETRKRRKAKEVGNALLLPFIIYGRDVGSAFPIDDSRCETSMSFEARASSRYLLNVVHSTQLEQPEELQILDARSGSLIARAIPSCRLLIEKAFPYSDGPIPSDKCAIHVLAGEDIRTKDAQFKLESVGPNWYQLKNRKAYTFIVEPGSYTIDASITGHTEFSKKPRVATRILQCEAGTVVYNLVDVEGFWSPRLAITDLPYTEAQRLAPKVVPGS